MDWFQIGKGVHQGCILSPYLFNLYAEYLIEMLGWMTDSQDGIKISGRNSNNLRYADDTTLLMRVKEESEKAGLRLTIPKSKIMASGPITS